MAEDERLERVVHIVTPEDADEEDRRFWATASIEERLGMLVRLRFMWMTEDERRLKRVFEIVKVP
jgi:hypothetical protein